MKHVIVNYGRTMSPGFVVEQITVEEEEGNNKFVARALLRTLVCSPVQTHLGRFLD